MFVSKRVLFFKSQRNGWMLFCGNSNSFYLIDDENVANIKKMFDTGNDEYLPDNIRKEFIKSGVLLNESDDDFFKRLKYQSYLLRFRTNHLSLTIAPTMACNFKCVYCYEGDRTHGVAMSDAVLDSIISFIKNGNYKNVDITWYGGEPLCAWEKIVLFNQKIEKLKLSSFSQSIVTNGSLIDKQKIDFFIEKNFSNVQITLDGNERTHNQNRPMKNGENSFQSIMHSLDVIFKTYKNEEKKLPCVIRVNLTTRNVNEFHEIYSFLNTKYENYFYVYPAFVTKTSENDCHANTCLTFEAEADFILNISKEYNIKTNKLFPERNKLVACGAQLHSNYVIDVNGDLYKCWEDIGRADKSIGNILKNAKDSYNINHDFILTSTGFENDTCKNCLFLYSCMGGCPRFRINNKKAGKEINPVCSAIKNKPEKFLEQYYELKQKNGCVY